MFQNLVQHPQLAGSAAKEVHFFTMNSWRGLYWYSRQFPPLLAGHLAVDASPTYFHLAQEADVPRRIKAIAPKSKIIILLRDPVERAVSHFRHLRRHEANKLLAGIAVDEFFDWNFRDLMVGADDLSRLRARVVRYSLTTHDLYAYFQEFGPAVIVIRTETMRSHGLETMSRVFSHLDVEPYEVDSLANFSHSSEEADVVSEEALERLKEMFASDLAHTNAMLTNSLNWPRGGLVDLERS